MNHEDRNPAAEVASNVNTEGAQASTIRRGGDIYQQVTDRIIEAMETAQDKGATSLWDGAGERAGLPVNHATGKPYTGINTLILWAAAGTHGYRSNRWMTYQQAKTAGGQVRKGEQGTQCVFYKPIEAKEVNEAGESEKKRVAVLKTFSLFNLDQIDGIAADATAVRPVFEPLAEAERILKESGTRITEGGNQAFYHRATDSIHLPDRDRFHSPENFYATALHELTHWTGHESRLNRTFGQRFGDEAYSMEELVAELGAAFAIAELGIVSATIEAHASYLDSWLRVLKSDKKAIFTAAAQAAKAHNYLMGRTAQAEAA